MAIRRGIIAWCFLFLLSTALAGCSSSPTASPQTNAPTQDKGSGAGEMTVNLGSEPQTIDPGLAEDIPSMSVARAAFDGLLRLGPDGKLHEAVAERYEVSPDGLTYTFHLRDSKWSNGDPVTAHDFEYAWKRVLDPATGSGYAGQLFCLKNAEKAHNKEVPLDQVGVKATDDKTLVVQLENPTPYFPQLVASVTYFPVNRKVVEGSQDWANEAATYVGNGPFKLASWEHKSSMTLVKNDSYWDKDHVKLSKLTFLMIEDASTELNMFKNGELDWAGSPLSDLPLDALADLKASGKLETKPTAGTYWYVFNTEKPPFNNKKIRQAFSLAVNRKEITDNVVQFKGSVALGILPPTMWFKPEGYFKDGDVETARKLLAEGMAELHLKSLPEITILYNTSELHQRIATVIQEQWRKAFGVQVKLVNQENKVKRENMKNGNFMIGRSSWIADFNDPINFFEVFRDKNGRNDARWVNDEYRNLLIQATKEPDPQKRSELLKRADAIIMDEMPVIPIYYYIYAWVKADGVKDVIIDDLGFIDFKYAAKEPK